MSDQSSTSVSGAYPLTAGAKGRIGIFTGGGDAPGLNGVIESVVRSLCAKGYEVVGIRDGFDGIFNLWTVPLTPELVQGVHAQAGTLLGTSNKTRTEGREAEFLHKFDSLNLKGLVVAGGDGTFAGLRRLVADLPIIGVPKTIDNDLQGTDVTFGFDTACAVVAESVDALRATADAHSRIIVVETMGRTAGWIALGGGLAAYADVILIPERPFSRADLLEFVKMQRASGRRGLLVVVSEGVAAQGEQPTVAFRVAGSPQPERFGGVAERMARWLEEELRWESRHVVLGHLQRSRAPTTTDRFLTLAMGVEAAALIEQEKWGHAVVYRGGKVTSAPLSEITKPARLVPKDHNWVGIAQAMRIFI